MGKGDRRTKRGKIIRGSFGVTRKKTVKPAKRPVAAKKAPAKKPAAKK